MTALHEPTKLEVTNSDAEECLDGAEIASCPPQDDAASTNHAAVSSDTLPDSSVSDNSPTPDASVPTEASAVAAQKVFNTAELLEHILTYLEPKEIMIAMRVDRLWRDSFEASVKLKRLLGLAPGGKFFYSPFLAPSIDSTPGIPHEGVIPTLPMKDDKCVMHARVGRRKSCCPHHGDQYWHGVRFHFAHNTEVPQHWLRHIGSRARDMAVCNPPLMEMTAQLACWGCVEEEEEGIPDDENEDMWYYEFTNIESKSDRGLTIGEIADAFAGLAGSKHLDCPGRHFFSNASVVVVDEDPIVQEWEKEVLQWMDEQESDSDTESQSGDEEAEDDEDEGAEESDDDEGEDEHTLEDNDLSGEESDEDGASHDREQANEGETQLNKCSTLPG
jgi:hypothetical protein